MQTKSTDRIDLCNCRSGYCADGNWAWCVLRHGPSSPRGGMYRFSMKYAESLPQRITRVFRFPADKIANSGLPTVAGDCNLRLA